MMRTGSCLIFAVLMAVLSGCPNGYKDMTLHDVGTRETEAGRETVLKSERYVAFREVIERSPNVKSVTRMTDLKGEKEPRDFALSPDGRWLAFQALEQKGGVDCLNLWRVSTAGGPAATRLTAGRYLDTEPSYGPDGKRVYFSSNRSSRMARLWRVRADGAGGITLITQAEAQDRWPDVGPDGQAIYYASLPLNAVDWQIWQVGADGSLPTQLKEGRRPQVSPDGSKVLYTAYDPELGKRKVWVMDADGTTQTQLTTGSESNDMHASWSPDGKEIVFASDAGKDSNGRRNYDIWIMDADGANLTQLTTNGSTDLLPAFSPDDKYIYLLSNRGFHWDIWRMERSER